MILSMTGFVTHILSEGGYTVGVTVRSLNSRYLDLNLKLPRNFFQCEEPLRSLVKKMIRRGRIDLTVVVESEKKMGRFPPINEEAVKSYWYQLRELSRVLPDAKPPEFKDILLIPYIYDHLSFEMLSQENGELAEKSCPVILKACQEAIERLNEVKAKEGRSLLRVFERILENMKSLVLAIESRRDEISSSLGERIKEKMKKVLEDASIVLDEHLILQEVALIADRIDITEEIVRLRAHIERFSELIFDEKNMADGKQLDFLVQEMHREATTMGSKLADLVVSENIVLLKTEIAKLKEQVQNIE